MQKLGSLGIVLTGISLIISSILFLSLFLYELFHGLYVLQIPVLWILVCAICHFIFGIGILRLKRWARWPLFLMLCANLLLTPYYFYYWYWGGLLASYAVAYLMLYGIGFYWIVSIVSLIILTRTKVKELFL